jgi:hypothetical protein
MADDARIPEERPPADGWSAHEEAQRRAWQRTTARERLAWLEDAKRFAAKAQDALHGRSRARREGDSDSSS